MMPYNVTVNDAIIYSGLCATEATAVYTRAVALNGIRPGFRARLYMGLAVKLAYTVR